MFARSPQHLFPLPRIAKFVLAGAVILICLWGIKSAVRVGESRWLIQRIKEPRLESPTQTAPRLLEETERAINKTPNDPEAHSGRALVLLNTHGVSAALPEFERAVMLRPKDYFLWLELGRARDMADDEQGAIIALEQSVRLAPSYAQPRWQFGNVLFRAGRVEDAYSELRRAALSDQELLPNFLDLVWSASNNDPAIVERIVNPESASWHNALAKFLIKRGKIREGLAHFRKAGGISELDRQTLLGELLAAKRFHEAYEVWAADSVENQRNSAIGRLNDGGFEGKVSRDNAGFVWQAVRDTPALRLSLDWQSPHEGTQSLRLDFNGELNPGQGVITQLILVEPGVRYRLNFAARIEDIVTGGLPIVSVSDVSQEERKILASSPTLSQNSKEWQKYSVEFTTEKTTSAVSISVHRQNCSAGPCPIFGRLWLDDFVIQKLLN